MCVQYDVCSAVVAVVAVQAKSSVNRLVRMYHACSVQVRLGFRLTA